MYKYAFSDQWFPKTGPNLNTIRSMCNQASTLGRISRWGISLNLANFKPAPGRQ
jgi:hypothetical protein